MPRRALRCVAELSLHAVSAPGVWLPSREDVYLSVSMFGQYRNTRLITSVFPLLVHEKFRFEKTYYTALDPSEVADYLEDELVVFELVQLSEYTDGAVRLASFSTNARDFLYPYPSLAPTYSSTDRELLLTRTVAFPGISPKLEFCTKTVIRESISPEVDALEDALDLERERRSSRKLRRSPTRRSRSAQNTSAESSYSLPASEQILDDSPPHYCLPTKASVSRCRSVSPTRRFSTLELSDTYTPRPPFVVRKLEKSLIGRVPGGGPDSHAKSGKTKKTLTYSSDDLNLGRSSFTSKYKVEKVIRDPLTDPLPVYTPKTVDDLDAEVAELTSRSLSSSYRSRPRSASPLLYRPTFRERYGLRPYSPTYYSYLADRVRRRIEENRRLGRTSPLWPYYYSTLDRLRLSSPYYYSDLYDLELATDLASRRSPKSLVHVDHGHYWTERAAQLGGKSHRELFNSNLSKSYNRLYRNSRSLGARKT